MSAYRQYYGGEVSRRRGPLATLFDLIMLILTILCAALMVCAYLAKYIEPGKAWFFAFAGLGAPLLFIANLIMALYWVVRWRLYVLLPVAVLLIGIGNLKLFFRPGRERTAIEAQGRKITFMTYNVMGFLNDENRNKIVSSMRETIEFINVYDPDILCIQEFQATRANPQDVADSLLKMPFQRTHYRIPNSVGGWGLAVYSKYPIVGTGAIDYPDSRNSSMWVDIRIGGDTVRLFNNHLQTTSVDREDRDYIDNQEFLSDGLRDDKVRSIAGKLKGGFIRRSAQADSLAGYIGESPYPVIVCGDFNDTPLSYAYATIRGDLSDAFVERGHGMSHTFQGLFNMFRIDYVLHSARLHALSYDSPEGGFSDHKPVIVEFDLR